MMAMADHSVEIWTIMELAVTVAPLD